MSTPVLIGADAMAGPDRLLRMVDALAEAFADLSAGWTQSPPRTVVEHGGDRQLLAGTAVWARRGVGSVKITTLTPDNPDRGLPLIHGVVVLTDLDTGRITALLDGGELTAVRTGAVAGLATRLCAPADAAELAVLGAGVQAHAMVRAVSAIRPITTVRVFSRGRERAEAFGAWIRAEYGHAVEVCDDAEAAVREAAVVCTATSTDDATPLVAADWVAPGAHVNIVGGTHEDAIEVDPALLAGAFTVVEQRAAAVDDAGEVRAALAAGHVTVDDLHELGELAVPTNGARPAGQISVFRSVGMPIEDTAVAWAIYTSAAG